ncbi:MAG: hypothetical protein EXS63_04670 [Candidatus Omnitrophica bacterium]|nr:hypothetical protein [Candidatus Omnitrophota bacterium]
MKLPTVPSHDERENLFWMDMLRAITIIGVIVIHVTADVITEWGAVPKSWWWAANLYDSLVRGCVPIFVMISGALLLPKTESLGSFFTKRFQRIAIPFIAWTLLYLLWKKYFRAPDLGIAEALRLAASGEVHFHLWFLYVLVGLYLVTPVFRILTAHATSRDLFYFLTLWFLVSSLLPFAETLGKLFTHTAFHLKLPVEPAEGFIGYFVLGYFLRQYATEKSLNKAWALWTLSLLVCAVGTYVLCRHFHTYQNLLYDNMAPNVVIYTASFFLLIKFAGPAFEKNLAPDLKSFILSISKASFGIYLIHPMILEALAKGRWGFVLKATMPHPAMTIPLTTATIFVLSFLAVLLIQKIPLLKKIV